MNAAIGIFGFSTIGLIVLLTVKSWENYSGHLLFASLRLPLRNRSQRLISYVRGDAPRSLGRTLRIARRVARAYISYAYASVLYFFEQVLERGLDRMRGSPGGEHRGEASPFLREVAAYKKMLEREKREAKSEE